MWLLMPTPDIPLIEHLVDVAWFDASVVGGAGSFMVDGKGNQTLNGGLALDFWFSKTTGIRLQTLGKFALEEDLLRKQPHTAFGSICS